MEKIAHHLKGCTTNTSISIKLYPPKVKEALNAYITENASPVPLVRNTTHAFAIGLLAHPCSVELLTLAEPQPESAYKVLQILTRCTIWLVASLQ